MINRFVARRSGFVFEVSERVHLLANQPGNVVLLFFYAHYLLFDRLGAGIRVREFSIHPEFGACELVLAYPCWDTFYWRYNKGHTKRVCERTAQACALVRSRVWEDPRTNRNAHARPVRVRTSAHARVKLTTPARTRRGVYVRSFLRNIMAAALPSTQVTLLA